MKNAAHVLRDLANDSLRAVPKDNPDSEAWFATINGSEAFIKFYAAQNAGKLSNAQSAVAVETAIAGGNLHRAIVPLRQVIDCADGTLLVYDRVSGENLGVPEVRRRFNHLPLKHRFDAVYAVGFCAGEHLRGRI